MICYVFLNIFLKNSWIFPWKFSLICPEFFLNISMEILLNIFLLKSDVGLCSPSSPFKASDSAAMTHDPPTAQCWSLLVQWFNKSKYSNLFLLWKNNKQTSWSLLSSEPSSWIFVMIVIDDICVMLVQRKTHLALVWYDEAQFCRWSIDWFKIDKHLTLILATSWLVTTFHSWQDLFSFALGWFYKSCGKLGNKFLIISWGNTRMVLVE